LRLGIAIALDFAAIAERAFPSFATKVAATNKITADV
jgi:hypothetical protein